MPCINGGTCIKISLDDYECKCEDGFSGTDCETVEEKGFRNDTKNLKLTMH